MEFLNRKKFGDPIPNINLYKKIWEKMHDKGYMKIFLAKYKEKIIASSLVFKFNNKVIYSYANSKPDYLKLRPNNLLLWKIIEWAFNNKCSLLDLGCSFKRSDGLIFFKSSFKAKSLPYAHYYFPGDSTLIRETSLGKIGKFLINRSPAMVIKPFCPFLNRMFV
jgi:hypothetical protein